LFSAYYLAANRGKKSVAVDLSAQEGREIIESLACSCDILVENFSVGVAKRLGFDYETLSEINPRLIYCSITGFGQTGPHKDKPGYDLLIQAMGGLMSITGSPEGEPTKVGVAVADLLTAFMRRRRCWQHSTSGTAADWASISIWRCWTSRSRRWPTRG